jgi:uncharacterized membrane protein YkoI
MHNRQLHALGLGVVLALSAASFSVVPAASQSAGATVADEDGSQSHGESTAAAAVQTQSDAITSLEAMKIARNETNGTVVGVRRVEADAGENGTPAYEVKVVRGNRTGSNDTGVSRRLLAVNVHATNGTILGTTTQTDEGGFFDTDESVQGITVANSLNLSTTRSAIVAADIATNNSTEENLTIRGVDLTLRDQAAANASEPPLVYVVDVENVNGGRVDILVSARRGQEGIISVEPQQGDDGND